MTVTPDKALLTGRVALVTGAASGIGEAIAVSLAAFGADLAVCDRDELALQSTAGAIEALGRSARRGVLDVRDGPAVDAFVADVADAMGHVDVLVNNAGGGFNAAFVDISAKGQSALVDENFTSVTHFVRACLPHMGAGGSIINLTSIEAFRAAPGFAVYAAMKAAVEELSRTLALELGERRIRVNCLAPDVIPTPGTPALLDAEREGRQSEFGHNVPLGLGHVDDCAAAAVFLAGDLSSFITGTTIHVDGGTHAASGWRRHPDGHWQT
jgi:NAD(P)-dependent dehydrogenase (short-subunit alcohol dehydrogenase family)